MRFRLPLLPLLLLLVTACYEDLEDCTDPDATNYAIAADERCGDCCEYPTLSLDIRRFFGADDLQLDSTYTDGGGNGFTLIDFRYYLGDISLVTADGPLDLPTDVQELEVINGSDTVLTELNVNAVLVQLSGSTSATVGRLPIGEPDLERLDLAFGLPDVLQAVRALTAPTGSPLRTQPRLLNFNDGRGYVQTRLEYRLAARPQDTVSVSTYGYLPVSLSIPETALPPPRGDNLTLELVADYGLLLGQIDLSADSATVASGLTERLPQLLQVTGAR